MTVALMQTATFDLGETTESLNLESFDATLQCGEVLFDARVGVLGDVLRAERGHDIDTVGRTYVRSIVRASDTRRRLGTDVSSTDLYSARPGER